MENSRCYWFYFINEKIQVWIPDARISDSCNSFVPFHSTMLPLEKREEITVLFIYLSRCDDCFSNLMLDLSWMFHMIGFDVVINLITLREKKMVLASPMRMYDTQKISLDWESGQLEFKTWLFIYQSSFDFQSLHFLNYKIRKFNLPHRVIMITRSFCSKTEVIITIIPL